LAIELDEVELRGQALEPLDALVGPARREQLHAAARRAEELLEGRVVWNINSTARGGGVAEMLQVLLAYARGAGADARWLVLQGDAEFFAITKRVHNHLHGSAGDGGPLDHAVRRHYDEVAATNAEALRRKVRRGDIALLHDPQTAGLVPPLREAGAVVVWRCHVGTDEMNDHARKAWEFLRPYLVDVPCIFSRAEYAPEWIDRRRVHVIPPSVDPFAPKNQDLALERVRSILSTAGVLADDATASPPEFTRRDGSVGRVARTAQVVRAGVALPPDVPLVVQISRWDRLKDMMGVMQGFAAHVRNDNATLALVGPEVAGVTDDPEGREVFDECVAAWRQLPPEHRARIQLITLPMDDVDENAAIVNALQRHATIVVQKSLAEGFGLTVAEAMWKGRPVVAGAVGGIRDQIVDGESGVLLPSPRDLVAFGAALDRLLDDPVAAGRLGEQARARVLERFLPDRHLIQYVELFGQLL
jgi:trehalose synthase